MTEQQILALYMCLVAFHMMGVVVTGIMWTIIDVRPKTEMRRSFRDIRAVHFGCLYLVPTLLGLAWAFERLHVPWYHQLFFLAGLFLLVFFSSIGYLFPIPKGLDPFYYWTKGPALVLAILGLICIVFCMTWTAAVLVIYSIY